MKSCMRSYETKRFPGSEISVTEIIFVSYTFPLSGKTFCLHFTQSTSQRETLPGKRRTFPRMNRTKLFDLSKYVPGNRDSFCQYGRALRYKNNIFSFQTTTSRKVLTSCDMQEEIPSITRRTFGDRN